MECGAIEPTANGFLRELGRFLPISPTDVPTAADQLARLGDRVVLALDGYEALRLLDSWLRRHLAPELRTNVLLLLAGRLNVTTAWLSSAGWRALFQSIQLESLERAEAERLLLRLGMASARAAELARWTRGHPLALRLAASSLDSGTDTPLTDASLSSVLHELTQRHLEDVQDDSTRFLLYGASVVRRVTRSTLEAIAPHITYEEGFARLRTLPFITASADGLVLHDAVRHATVQTFAATDPESHLAVRRRAWQRLQQDVRAAPRGQLWRYTADILYLLENPTVREAFFPSGGQSLAVDMATPGDGPAVERIVRKHESQTSALQLLSWWQTHPSSFSVVRGAPGMCTGFYLAFDPASVDPDRLERDPVTRRWLQDLRERPMPPRASALFCRRWLSFALGEAPSDVQAACWLDLKRTYMEMRPLLRRVYLLLEDLEPYAAAASKLGFVPLKGTLELDGRRYTSAVLDFGLASVDGWLAQLVAAELGIDDLARPVALDQDTRELVFDGQRSRLTPLEFGLLEYLMQNSGKAISRSTLLEHVWKVRSSQPSNVVDVVVRSVRRKLAGRSKQLQTVNGVGYRWCDATGPGETDAAGLR